MKSKFAVLLAIQLLISCVVAISVQDAFTKDWISYNYGDLVKCSVLGTDSVLCLSKSNILYQIGASDASIKYYIDLRKVSNNAFTIAGSNVITYADGSPKVYIWDKDSGILNDELTFDGSVHSISESLGDVFVTMERGIIEVLTFDTLKIVKDGIQDPHKSVDEVYRAVQDKKFDETYARDESLNGVSNKMIFDQRKDARIITDGTKSYLAVISSFGILVANVTDLQETSIPAFVVSAVDNFEDIGIFGDNVVVLSSDKLNFYVSVKGKGLSTISESILARTKPVYHGRAILVDKPLSLSTIDEVHHLVEETHSKSVLFRWLLRTKTHLAQLGKLISDIVSKKDFMSGINEISKDQFGFHKILIFFDDQKNELVARESSDGLLLWNTSVNSNGDFVDVFGVDSEVVVIFSHLVVAIDLRTGEVSHSEHFSEAIDAAFKIWCEATGEDEEVKSGFHVAGLRFGDRLKTWGHKRAVAPSQFVLTESDDIVHAYKLSGEKLIPTWSFSDGDRILSVTKNTDDITSAIGITRFDRSVLYKYLNPNLITVISTQDSTLRITLLDGITGSVLHVQEHNEEFIDFTSVNVVQSDNWVIYSYQANYPAVEQRIIVLDLFSTSESALGGDKSVADGTYNSTIATVSSKSFLFPERILAMKSSTTKFGITIRSVIALTDSGSLIELPKYVLNSRRIDDRKMTQQDAEDDFRLMPYEPVVNIDTQKVLNHKIKLQLSASPQQILARPTGLESSGVICFINEFNEFCTIVQPSSSYDLLSGSFEKVKLFITIAALFVAYLASKPFVYSQKLNAKWIY